MVGDYSIQFADKKPVAEKVFSDFASLRRYIEENKAADWANRVNVHLPARASTAEREAIRAMGFQSN